MDELCLELAHILHETEIPKQRFPPEFDRRISAIEIKRFRPVLPPDLELLSIKVDRYRELKGELLVACNVTLLFRYDGQVCQLVLRYDAYHLPPPAPTAIALQCDGCTVLGGYLAWFRDAPSFVPKWETGHHKLKLRSLLGDLLDLYVGQGGFDLIAGRLEFSLPDADQPVPDRLRLLEPRSIFSTGLFEGWRFLPADGANCASLTVARFPFRERLDRPVDYGDSVATSLGCFKVEQLADYLAVAPRELISVLKREDWLQVILHPRLAPERRSELQDRFVERFYRTSNYPTHLLFDTGSSRVADRLGIKYLVHCTSFDILRKILQTGFLAQAGEMAGHRDPDTGAVIPIRHGATAGLGVYAMYYKNELVHRAGTGYGEVCLLISKRLFDRRSGFRQFPITGISLFNNFMVNGYSVDTLQEMQRPDQAAPAVGMTVFRDKVPLGFVDEIWVGAADVDRTRELLIQSGYPRMADKVRVLGSIVGA